jgi:hypothetical protein
MLAVDFPLQTIQLSLRFDAKRSNARIDAAGRIERSIQSTRMTSKLIPLALNELLCRPSLKSFNLYCAFDLQFESTPLPVF